MWVLFAIMLGGLFVAALVFVTLNLNLDQRVTIDLYFKRYDDVRLLYALLWAFVCGAGMSALLFISGYIKQMARLSRAKRAIKGLNAEVAALRNRPIEESRDIFGEDPTEKKAVKNSEVN